MKLLLLSVLVSITVLEVNGGLLGDLIGKLRSKRQGMLIPQGNGTSIYIPLPIGGGCNGCNNGQNQGGCNGCNGQQNDGGCNGCNQQQNQQDCNGCDDQEDNQDCCNRRKNKNKNNKNRNRNNNHQQQKKKSEDSSNVSSSESVEIVENYNKQGQYNNNNQVQGCQDIAGIEYCSKWVRENQCNENPKYVKTFCKKSCGVCY